VSRGSAGISPCNPFRHNLVPCRHTDVGRMYRASNNQRSRRFKRPPGKVPIRPYSSSCSIRLWVTRTIRRSARKDFKGVAGGARCIEQACCFPVRVGRFREADASRRCSPVCPSGEPSLRNESPSGAFAGEPVRCWRLPMPRFPTSFEASELEPPTRSVTGNRLFEKFGRFHELRTRVYHPMPPRDRRRGG